VYSYYSIVHIPSNFATKDLAEINAFYAQGKRAIPDNLAVMVHDITNHALESDKDLRRQIAASQKNEQPEDIPSTKE
jgi:hypothetical protein